MPYLRPRNDDINVMVFDPKSPYRFHFLAGWKLGKHRIHISYKGITDYSLCGIGALENTRYMRCLKKDICKNCLRELRKCQ